jgi:hypothetical protein
VKPKKIARKGFLFHPAHGLCRVDRLTEEERAGQKILCYSIVPKAKSKMKVRFVVAVSDAESSGFHKVISVKEAGKLLEHSIKGLVGELACAFKTSLKETASRIEQRLTKASKVDALVLAALGRAAED